MHTLNVFFSITVVLCCCMACQQSVPLFERDSGAWVMEGNAQWNFTQEALVGVTTGTEGFIMTKNTYEDFQLELEFYPDSTINSGVFVRCKAIALDASDCHEMNIWDLHPNQEFRTGAIVTKAAPKVTVNTLNKWNTYRIRCLDDQVSVWVNDSLTASFEDGILGPGHIGLQAAGKGTIKFRNIALQEL